METHGTLSAYKNGCRCDICRSGVAAYQRRRQREKRDGTWKPYSIKKERQACSVEGCDRVARYVTPIPLCGGHKQQDARGVGLGDLKRKQKVVDGEKECRLCGESKPIDEFHSRKDGAHIASECKVCYRIYQRALRYDISFETTKWLMGQPCSGCGATENLHIDHDHIHGVVRGVLCHNCNTVLTVHMTPTTLRRLADYLEPFHNI